MTKTAVTVGETVLRKPQPKDAQQVYQLIQRCGGLDLNSIYCYLLQCTHFSDTCVLAESEDDVVAFASGYRKPTEPGTLFIWQVAVDASARGQGLAKRLLLELLAGTPHGSPVSCVEATITRSNEASFALFESLGRLFDAPCTKTLMFSQDDFGTTSHEEEVLIRIGPINPQKRKA